MSDLQQIFGNGFDTSSVPPQEDYAVLPPGDYPLLVEKAEVKQTKTGTGHYIKLTLQVLDGQFKGRKLFDNINIQNQSAQCEEIGRRSLAALGLALGIPMLQDTAQLLNKVATGAVKVDKEGQNTIRTYKPVTSGNLPAGQQHQYVSPAQQQQYAPPQPPPPPPQSQQQYVTPPVQQVPSGTKPPWAR